MGDNINHSEYTPGSYLLYGAEGSGYYSKAIRTHYDLIQAATPLTLEAIDKDSLQLTDGPFVICDYGTADGGISMVLIRNIIDKVQDKYGAGQQVHVIYEDQPISDFKSLLLRIHGFIPDPPTYLSDHKNVFVSFCGTNFYSQCLPDNSVHLAFSQLAVQCLSKRPCNISGGHILHVNCKDEDEKRLFAQQAAWDWETFLLHRAKELKKGGQMIIISLAVDETGQHVGNTKNCPHNIYEKIAHHWRTMLQDDLISQEEFDGATFNFCYRTKAEHCAPFRDQQSAVRLAGLQLISMEIKIIQCSFHQQWLQQSDSGEEAISSQKFAHSFVGALRTWSNHTFFSALSEDRPDHERRAITDECFQRFEKEVAKNPQEYALDYVVANIHIAKRN